MKAQGCVAIKGMPGVCGKPGDTTKWSLDLNNRYFRSYKHFIGTEEQKQRVDSGTNVMNHSYEFDMTLTRVLTTRWSVSLTMPVMDFSRSSLYEHDGKNRHVTHSFGIGDIRFDLFRWLINPLKHPHGNVQTGLGIKLPTGNAHYQDYFYKKPDSLVLGAVDQSIQPGDGGTGITVDLNAFYNFSHRMSLYGNFYYLINPREVNGTSTARGGTPSATAKKYNTDVMSVPDLFMCRGGATYMSGRFSFSAGLRIEGLPAHDLLGGSRGFRRPGYILSAEPSLVYSSKKSMLNFSLPVALVRNRTQSNADKRQSADTGKHVQGDAAFADYLISAGITIKL